MRIPLEVRYRSFYLRHRKLQPLLPSWRVYIKLPPLRYRMLHPDDRTECPGIRDCERCATEWLLGGDLKYIKEPVGDAVE